MPSTPWARAALTCASIVLRDEPATRACGSRPGDWRGYGYEVHDQHPTWGRPRPRPLPRALLLTEAGPYYPGLPHPSPLRPPYGGTAMWVLPDAVPGCSCAVLAALRVSPRHHTLAPVRTTISAPVTLALTRSPDQEQPSRRVCAVRSFPAAALGCLLFPGQARQLSDPSPAACYVSVPTRAGQRSLAVPHPGAHCAAARPATLLGVAPGASSLPSAPDSCGAARGRKRARARADRPSCCARASRPRCAAACGALAGPAPAAPPSWRQEDRSTPLASPHTKEHSNAVPRHREQG
jgi:hypothetical protein